MRNSSRPAFLPLTLVLVFGMLAAVVAATPPVPLPTPVLLPASSPVASAVASSSRTPLAEGVSAPILALQDLEGRIATFPVAGEWNLVFFWSLFCHSCLEEIPLLASESARFADLPCSAFFVSLDTARMRKGLENYRNKRRLGCRILLEETVASTSYFAADQWGVSQTPTTFLVDPAGRVAFQRQGPFDQEELWTMLRQRAGAGKAP